MAQYAFNVAGTSRKDIQDQINAAHTAGGGVVYLPAGTYKLDNTIQLKSNVSLVGVGEATVLQMTGSNNGIELDGGANSTIRNIEISNLVIWGPNNNANIEAGVSGKSDQGCGITASNQTIRNLVIRSCRIEHVGGCGIRIVGSRPVINVTIRDCQLLQNKRPPETGKPDSYKDIYFAGVAFENIIIEGNVCTFTPTGASTYGNDSGIAFATNSNKAKGHIRNVRITGNVCSGHRRHGLITSYELVIPDGVFVSANRCEDNGWAGIYLNTDVVLSDDRTTDVKPNPRRKPDQMPAGTFTDTVQAVISGNICNHNGYRRVSNVKADESIKGGIVLMRAHHTIIANNICMNNGTPGTGFKKTPGDLDSQNKDIARHAAGIRVRGMENIVEGNLVKGNQHSGIATWPPDVGRVSITNNRAINNQNHGIEVAGQFSEDSNVWAKQIMVTGNTCAKNAQAGIRISETIGALVASNTVLDNKIEVELNSKTQDVTVQGNNIKNGAAGIRKPSSTKNKIFVDGQLLS